MTVVWCKVNAFLLTLCQSITKKSDNYIFYGKLVNHVKYGIQFQVDNYERCMPEEKDSIIEFLESDLFPGIG